VGLAAAISSPSAAELYTYSDAAGERTLFGPDLVKDAEEKVKVIKENLKMARMRQNSYHDKGTAPETLKWEITCI
jgi:hypothetical protein